MGPFDSLKFGKLRISDCWSFSELKTLTGCRSFRHSESAIFQFFVRVKEYMSIDSDCSLVICLLQSLMAEQIAEARSMGSTTNSLSEASLGDVGEISIVILVSLFNLFVCCFRFSGVLCVLSQYTDCPNCTYSLRRDCKRDLGLRDLKNFRHVRWKCQSFSKLPNTTSR